MFYWYNKYMNKITLNNEFYNATENDFPYLVVYGEKSGGSHFSVTLMAELFSSGSKILFFTAFPMATDNFLGQIGSDNSNVAIVKNMEDLKQYENSQAIILDSGNEILFLQAIKELKDINERIILVKNIEAFSDELLDSCLNFKNIILSGDIDTCVSKEKIIKKTFKSVVVFTKPETSLSIDVPELEKWTGYLDGGDKKGIIKVKVD